MREPHGKELKQLMADSQQEIEVLSLASCKELNAANKQVSLEGNPSLARVPGRLSCISGSSLMVNDEKIRGALGRVVFRSLHMPRDFSP